MRRQQFLGAVAAFKRAPAAAGLPRTVAALLGLLRPPPPGARRSPLLALLAAAALQRGWADVDEWPQVCVPLSACAGWSAIKSPVVPAAAVQRCWGKSRRGALGAAKTLTLGRSVC